MKEADRVLGHYAREWPVDAANLLKFIGYLLLGLGSSLGGAIVERILVSPLRCCNRGPKVTGTPE